MTLNELFARFDKLAAVRALGLRGGDHTVVVVVVGGRGGGIEGAG